MRRFSSFCNDYRVPDPFPVTENLLCSFAAFLADAGLAPQTVKSYLAAIRNTQLSLGLPDPREQSSLPILRRVLAGISRSRLGRGVPSRVRLPVTASLLSDIRRELVQSTHPERLVLWAVCSTAFFGFFRLGELLLTNPADFDSRRHLAWGDMAVDDPQAPSMVRIHLKQSKTDPFGRGADIVLGRTGGDLCPVAAVLTICGVQGLPAWPILHPVDGKTVNKTAVCGRDQKDFDCSRPACPGIRRTQLPHRGSHLSRPGWGGGLNYPVIRALAERSLPALYPDPSGDIGCHFFGPRNPSP